MNKNDEIRKNIITNVKKKFDINVRIIERLIKINDEIITKNQESKEVKIIKKIIMMKKSYESLLVKLYDMKNNFGDKISYEKAEPIIFRSEEKFWLVLSDSYEIYTNMKEICKDEKINKDLEKICNEIVKFMGLNEAWMDALNEELKDMLISEKDSKISKMLQNFNESFKKFKELPNDNIRKIKSSQIAVSTLMKVAIGIVTLIGGWKFIEYSQRKDNK